MYKRQALAGLKAARFKEAAASFLAFIKAFINDVPDKLAAARRWVPLLIGVMAGAFAAYLSMKGLKKIVTIELGQAVMLGTACGFATWLLFRPIIRRQSAGMENRKRSLKVLFAVPLIASAALLSFAHGANDVANAVGPLAAIVHAVQDAGTSDKVTIPLWVMMIGAAGISFGLMLFGPKLIRMVGQEITKLNPMRAYCVALSAAITVIIASGLGLPVSSTHIAVGAVMGVGLARGIGALDLRVLGNIVVSWFITLPVGAALAAIFFYLLKAIFGA